MDLLQILQILTVC